MFQTHLAAHTSIIALDHSVTISQREVKRRFGAGKRLAVPVAPQETQISTRCISRVLRSWKRGLDPLERGERGRSNGASHVF